MLENLTRLFVFVDDFYKAYSEALDQYVKENSYALPSKNKYESKTLSLSEIMTILITFHQSHYYVLYRLG